MKLNVTRPVALIALSLAVATSITCSGDDLGPPDTEVSAIQEVAGNGQTGRVGQSLADPIAVKVTDVNQNPVSGVRVEFTVATNAPGASASPAAVSSGSDGIASAIWTLPTTAGSATIVAQVAGAPTLAVTFMATAVAASAETILAIGGQDQAGQPMAQLPESLKVQVTDQFLNPVAGVPVSWAATGEGSVSPAETTTDANGYAATARTLGNSASSSTASASGLKGSPVTFTHRVVQPAAVVVITPPSSNAQSGTPLAQQPVIEVRDAGGTVLDGIQVVASVESGGGTLSGTRTAMTTGGAARFADLALTGATGPQVLRFTSGSVFTLSSPITVTAGPSTAQGQWSAPVSMPLVGIHISLLPNGKLMMFSRTTQPYLWDPTEPQTFTISPVPTNVFCSGHTLLPDGTLFVVGGHIDDDAGLPDLNLFNPAGNVWSRQPNMLVGRWYPTATVLANGDVLVLGGRDENREYAVVPEIWNQTTGWRRLTGSGVARPMPYFPACSWPPTAKRFSPVHGRPPGTSTRRATADGSPSSRG